MRRASLLAAAAFAIVGGALPAKAAEASEDSAQQAEDESQPTETTAKPTGTADQGPPQPAGRSQARKPDRLPRDASAALVRAAAAYEYGDLNQVVEAARLVAEGSLPATQEQQVQALRWLGIGLYLTNRPLGAETAFTELLRKDPSARLDPTTTRPELVSYFESLRHQHLARQRSTRKLLWNFIPPGGQFQNGDNTKGWLILGAGVVAAATSLTTYALDRKWRHADGTSDHPDTAQTFRTVNPVSGAVLIALYIYGVVDGLVGYSRPIDDARPSLSLHLFPGGGGLGFTF
jgi:hypothetical protein